MDSNRIEELLQKYWNGETSLEDEQQLHVYFQSDDIPEHLKETALLFRYFETQKNTSLQDVMFDSGITNTLTAGKTRKLVYNSLRIAAGLAVLIAAIWFVRKEPPHPITKSAVAVDTYNDPKLAFEETKKALMMISNSFAKAEEQAKRINLFNEAQQEVKPQKR